MSHSTDSKKEWNMKEMKNGLPSSIYCWRSWLDLKSSPWVLVTDGSLLGYFDWVPIQYRIGPWHPVLIVSLVLLVLALAFTAPWMFLSFVAQDFQMLFLDMRRAETVPQVQGDTSMTNKDPIAMSSFASIALPLPVSSPSYCASMTMTNSPMDAILSTASWKFYFNALLFAYMIYHTVSLCVHRTPGIIATFTIQSWLINCLRYGVHVMFTLFHCNHSFETFPAQESSSSSSFSSTGNKSVCWYLQTINEISRFPALATATMTFITWNFILFPYLIKRFFSNSLKRRRDFIRWNSSFNMVQLHFCNLYYSIMNVFVTENDNNQARFLTLLSNTCSTARTQSKTSASKNESYFQFHDLWFGVCYGVLYALFYVLVLDRLGVHIYGPLFSPRNKWSALVLFSMVLIFTSTFYFWNFLLFSSIQSNTHHHHLLDPPDRSLSERNQNLVHFWRYIIPCYGGIFCLAAIIFSFLLRRYYFVPMEDIN